MKKRFLCMLLIICTASRLLPAGAFAAESGRALRRGADGLIPCIGENGNRRPGDTDTGVKAMADKAASAGEAPAKESSIAVAAAAAAIAGAALIGNIVLLAVVLKRRKGRI